MFRPVLTQEDLLEILALGSDNALVSQGVREGWEPMTSLMLHGVDSIICAMQDTLVTGILRERYPAVALWVDRNPQKVMQFLGESHEG